MAIQKTHAQNFKNINTLLIIISNHTQKSTKTICQIHKESIFTHFQQAAGILRKSPVKIGPSQKAVQEDDAIS